MRIITTSIFTLFTVICLHAQLFNFGVGTGIVFSDQTAFGPQIRLQYNMDERFNMAASYNYYITKDSGSAFDFDLRYKLFQIGNVRINPMAGIGYRNPGGVNLNVGLVTEIPQNSFLIYIEPKFIIDETVFFALTGGILF